MLEGVLNVGYSDHFEIDVEYGIDKYLKYEATQLFRVKPLKSIEPMPIHSKRQMPRGFAVICYNVGCIFSEDYCIVEYEIFFGDSARGNTIISRDVAISLIETQCLNLVVENKDGKVWE